MAAPSRVRLRIDMRLSKIKLSGFKSFVDPTTISFPSNLMGIVGPNGCGKSNIIDAIRWVLGESSAKTLRGDSMADVIFNGSSTRKPIGQASIELVFDNSDGKITGSYAGFAEVAMRRVVTRDGTSQYFLNNTRCRRKDITNLLLGTGVGSHGYSIIEQGMISRLVEAKPEELRAFLEEAAGISKYKERRRETEHRIRHTRDNMERLDDLRDELEKQLSHLHRQAKAAERFKVLKSEERKTDAELMLLRLRALLAELEEKRKAMSKRQLALDAAVTAQRETEANIEKLRIDLADRSDEFNAVQGVYYRVGANIARLEQTIQHRNANIQSQSAELAQAEQQLEEVSGHISSDEIELREIEELLSRLDPELDEAQSQLAASERALKEAEADAERHRDRVEALSEAVATAERTIQVEEARAEQYTSRLGRIDSERAEKEAERESMEAGELEREVEMLAAAEEGQRSAYEAAVRSMERTTEEILRLRKEDSTMSVELDELRDRLQRDRGRLSSLEALQEAALGISADAQRWLESTERAQSPKLATQLQVAEGWERAVESVLGAYLHAISVNRLEEVSTELEALIDSGLALIELEQATAADNDMADFEPLALKVQHPTGAKVLLSGFFAAPTLASALEMRSRLAPGQTLVTPDGVQVGRHALRTNTGDDPQLGVIARGEEIESLRESVGRVSLAVEEAAGALAETRARLESQEEKRAEDQAAVNECQRAHADTKMRLATGKARIDDLRERVSALEADIVALEDERYSLNQALQTGEARLKSARAELETQTGSRRDLEREREEVNARLGQSRTRAEQDRERVKEIAIMVESRRSTKQSASAALARVQAQQRYLVDRRAQLARQVEELEAPLADERRQLEVELDERLSVEQRLNAARTAVESSEEDVRTAESRRAELQQSVNDARDGAEAARMTVRETEVRSDTVREQFVATGFDQSELAAELPEEASVGEWTEKLESVGRKIQRLGAINLAAIDEFEEKSERKQYLDKQHEDLSSALDTLEAAIKKIDGETRSRFRETFDHANQGLGELFPRLFGGGHAFLELENDDLLSAGVTIMARPPGKRISTIHLLSGGEKALTAVALVFSIFKLNPAPFCLLDEVDAPLDDANVGRFSEIVKEMSDAVQFIIITHNKTTMESMRQLSGVTMHEPGVSRLVAVDIDEAVKLAAM